jgi:hypothetical protein
MEHRKSLAEIGSFFLRFRRSGSFFTGRLFFFGSGSGERGKQQQAKDFAKFNFI